MSDVERITVDTKLTIADFLEKSFKASDLID